MNQASTLGLLLYGVVGATGCSSEPDSAFGGAAGSSVSGGSASGGSAGTTLGGGSNAGAGGNITPTGGSASSAGSAGQSAAGTNVGGAAGAAQGGQTGGGMGGTAGASSGGSGGSAGLPPLQECTSQASVDRLTQWTASGEGTTVPATGSILVKDGADYVGKVELVGGGWHVIPVLIANKFDVSADLSKSAGITLTYSATAELHVQLRSKSHWSGGDQYATTIPSTNGKVETHFFSFAAAGWKSLFGAPVLSYADTLKEGMGLVFVGDGQNTVVFSGLRIDGYTPPCQ